MQGNQTLSTNFQVSPNFFLYTSLKVIMFWLLKSTEVFRIPTFGSKQSEFTLYPPDQEVC